VDRTKVDRIKVDKIKVDKIKVDKNKVVNKNKVVDKIKVDKNKVDKIKVDKDKVVKIKENLVNTVKDSILLKIILIIMVLQLMNNKVKGLVMR